MVMLSHLEANMSMRQVEKFLEPRFQHRMVDGTKQLNLKHLAQLQKFACRLLSLSFTLLTVSLTPCRQHGQVTNFDRLPATWFSGKL
jgi:hypothetical protein